MSYLFKIHPNNHEIIFAHSPDECIEVMTKIVEKKPVIKVRVDLQGNFYLIYWHQIRKYARIRFNAAFRSSMALKSSNHETDGIYV